VIEPVTAAVGRALVGVRRVALITIALVAVLAPPALAWQPSDSAYMHKYERAGDRSVGKRT
jgi:hypothetical protein